MAQTYRPSELGEALQFLQDRAAMVMAGGTDIYPAHVGRPLTQPVLDVGLLKELRAVQLLNVDGQPVLELGAALSWTTFVRREHPELQRPLLDSLAMAAAEVGGVQIQNRGTLAGNLCNASPAADGVPALIALDAAVVLVRHQSERIVPVAQFITGPRQTQLQRGELVRAIRIPMPPTAQSHSAFMKLGHRRYLVISAVMVAVRLDWDKNLLAGAAIAVGSCGPVASRLHDLESSLLGQTATELQVKASRPLPPEYYAALSPISDLRGSDRYRLDVADTVVRRVLGLLASRPGQSVGPRHPHSGEVA